MLVLTRAKNEAIVIGEGHDAITVMVTDIKGNRVRLGVVAPRSIPVHRQEVAEAIIRGDKRKSKRSVV